MPGRRPEIELLLHCARPDGATGAADRIRTLLQGNVDWEYLLRTASSQRVTPLLYRKLESICPEAVPEDVLGRLRDYFHANHLRNLFLTGELLKLLDELEAHGIPAIPYKGPVLSALVYGNLALREFGDLDVLVRKEDAAKAGEILVSLGYRSQHRMTKAQEAALLRYDRQYLFVKGDSAVELHWTVTPRPVSFLLDPENLWSCVRQIPLGGGTVASLSPEDLLLVLCVHGSAHRWERLGWIRDVAELIRVSTEDVDWERLVERASSLNSRRMFLLGLSLANDLLDADLPREILCEAQADEVVRALATEVRGRLFSADRGSHELSGEPARWRFHLRMLDSLRDRFRYCIHQIATPNSADWEAVVLPIAVSSLYRLVRPLRLGGKLVRGSANPR